MFKAIKENKEFKNTMAIVKKEIAKNCNETILYINYPKTVERLKEEPGLEVNYNGCGMFIISWN